MKILLLGGPNFLGYHLIEAALDRGHNVTLFNRGRTNPDLFPGLHKLVGDRDGSLDALKGQTWDAAIDTCGYVPRLVSASAELLSGAAGHYTFISSISVYADPNHKPLDEKAPVGDLEDSSIEEITGETYGPLKALCERAAEEAMPGRVLNVRSGLIVGPRDPTDRFTYWPARIARGGQVLAPHSPAVPVQLIDVRDLSKWIVGMIEAGKTGLYNATGPDYPLRLGKLLDVCMHTLQTGEAGRNPITLNWASEKFLLENNVEPWMELPLWIPEQAQSMMRADIHRALADRLTFRSLAETVRDTFEWHLTRSPEHAWHAGLSPEREKELLEKWKNLGPDS